VSKDEWMKSEVGVQMILDPERSALLMRLDGMDFSTRGYMLQNNSYNNIAFSLACMS